MKKVSIAARLPGIGPAVPDVMADYACDGPAMLGVIRIAAGSSDHHWERHGCGDEVLYLLAGRALFTAVGAAGTDEVLVEAGDLLVLERDEAHRGRVLEDVTVLFLTPRHGNVAWRAGARSRARSPSSRTSSVPSVWGRCPQPYRGPLRESRVSR